MNRLVVMFEYASRCKNIYCVAIVAHRWLRRIRYRFENPKFVYIHCPTKIIRTPPNIHALIVPFID